MADELSSCTAASSSQLHDGGCQGRAWEGKLCAKYKVKQNHALVSDDTDIIQIHIAHSVHFSVLMRLPSKIPTAVNNHM